MTREPRRTAGSRRLGATKRSGLGFAGIVWVAVAAAVVLVGTLLRTTLPPVRTYTPDEQTYTTFAAGLSESGLGQYGRTVREFAKDSTLAELPPPTRAGFLVLAAAAMKLIGSDTPRAIVALSTAASVLVLVAAVLAAGLLASSGAAAITAVLLAVSPMDLAIARRAWQDDVFALCGAAILAAVAWRASRRRFESNAAGRREAATRSTAAPTIAFFALSGWALLVKESALPLLALGTALLAWWSWREGGVRAALPILGGFVVTLGAITGLLAGLAGWAPVARTWQAFLSSPATNAYVRKYQTGSPLYYAQGLLILQPLAAVLGAAGTAIGVARPRWLAARSEASRRALFALAVMTAGFVVITVLLPVKSLRFLSPAVAPAALLGAAALVAGLRALRTRTSTATFRFATAAVTVVLAFAAWQDLRRFYDLFVRRAIPDLATPWFTAK